MNKKAINKLPACRSDLDREEIIFTKHYFEHGCVLAAAEAAGYKPEVVQFLKMAVRDPGTIIGGFFQELCRDRVSSTVISTEKKRARLWKLIEWATDENAAGVPNDSKLALKCMDMLNKMDGDYKPIQFDNKHQIHKQTVHFNQNIPPTKVFDIDEAIESHAEVLDRKTG